MKNCRFSSVWTQFEPSSAGPVHGSTHPLPTVRFWLTVQANTSENQTKLNFGIPISGVPTSNGELTKSEMSTGQKPLIMMKTWTWHALHYQWNPTGTYLINFSVRPYKFRSSAAITCPCFDTFPFMRVGGCPLQRLWKALCGLDCLGPGQDISL